MSTFWKHAIWRHVTVGALLATTSDCANLVVGSPLDPGRAREIEPLRTKRSEVHALLGAPLRTDRVGDVRLDVHKHVTPQSVKVVVVSYREGDEVVHVTVAD